MRLFVLFIFAFTLSGCVGAGEIAGREFSYSTSGQTFSYGRLEIDALGGVSIETRYQDGWERDNTTGPGEQHVNFRRNHPRNGPDRIWVHLPDEQVVRAYIPRCTRQGECRIGGNLLVVMTEEGWRYLNAETFFDFGRGYGRAPQCTRSVRGYGSERLCSYQG